MYSVNINGNRIYKFKKIIISLFYFHDSKLFLLLFFKTELTNYLGIMYVYVYECV